MTTNPSFAALYRQSRYGRNDDDPRPPTRQNRKELFAVASVAFVMKHDREFRRAFLEQVCDVAEPNLADEFEIEIQPAFHADLRIHCPARKALYIVEFKVNAELMKRQDFSRSGDFLKTGDGYGWRMLNVDQYRDCTEKTYVVLQSFSGFEDGFVEGIKVLSRTWKHLVRKDAKESSLTSDLLDTIGAWILLQTVESR